MGETFVIWYFIASDSFGLERNPDPTPELLGYNDDASGAALVLTNQRVAADAALKALQTAAASSSCAACGCRPCACDWEYP